MSRSESEISIRSELRPGDIGLIVQLHGVLYAREYGFDISFEAYVAGTLAESAISDSLRSKIWLVEKNEQILGCIAIVEVDNSTAQLRWFVLDPSIRGLGIGKKLIEEAVRFAREQHYATIELWTVSPLIKASRLYQWAGFKKVQSTPGRHWGVEMFEEKYEFRLVSDEPNESSSSI